MGNRVGRGPVGMTRCSAVRCMRGAVRVALDRADRTCRVGTTETPEHATRPVSARPTTGRIVPVVAFVAGLTSLSIGGRRRRDSTPCSGLPSDARGMGTRIFGRRPRARVCMGACVRGVTLCSKMYSFIRRSSVDGRGKTRSLYAVCTRLAEKDRRRRVRAGICTLHGAKRRVKVGKNRPRRTAK